MYNVKADVAKNCLFITLKGYMEEAEAKQAADTAIQELAKLKTGFIFINDISEFSPTTQKATEEIKRVQACIAQKGVKKVIRIVGKVSTEMQFQRTQKEVHADYEVITVKSMDEALKNL